METETLLPLGKLDPGIRSADTDIRIDTIKHEAQLAEELGFHALVMEETKDDPFQILALAANTTKNIRIATSVAIAFARSPFVLAESAWTLQKISNGRFELGIGSQVRGHINRRYGIPWKAAGPWMRDYVLALKAMWESWQQKTELDFNSEHYQLNLNVPLFIPAPIEFPNIPIHVAAVNKYMCKVACEVADGVRLHPICAPEYIKTVLLPEFRNATANDFQICLKPLVACAETRNGLDERREVVRERLAFYASTPSYSAPFEKLGYGDLCAEMAFLSKGKKWDKMKNKIDDEIIELFAVVDTYDRLSNNLISRYSGLIDRLEISLAIPTRRDSAIIQEIISELASAHTEI